jgi:hypothetical protein
MTGANGSKKRKNASESLVAHWLTTPTGRRANCYDKTPMELFWSSMKREVLGYREVATRVQARCAIFYYIGSFLIAPSAF